jgi:hypothetical protein
MSESIDILGKGLLPQPPDQRDYNAAFLTAGAAPVDFQKGSGLSRPPGTNQGTSDCCVGEAASSYHWQLRKKRYAVRSVFAYIAQSYGAYLRDGVKQIVEHGQQLFEQIPDPSPKTASNMRMKAGLDSSLAAAEKELRYYSLPDSIEAIAQAIRDLNGSLFGVFGDNIGWRDIDNPLPPENFEWAHALYGVDYHVHDGQKCIIAHSSWCDGNHREHHIKENYFKAGAVFNSWILAPKEVIMNIKRYIVDKNGKLGVLVSVDGDGVFSDVVMWAKNELHLGQLKQQYEIPADAPVIKYP